jgi:hypothetical protein
LRNGQAAIRSFADLPILHWRADDALNVFIGQQSAGINRRKAGWLRRFGFRHFARCTWAGCRARRRRFVVFRTRRRGAEKQACGECLESALRKSLHIWLVSGLIVPLSLTFGKPATIR